MPIFLFEDEGKKLGNRQLIIPQNLVKHLQKQANLYSGDEYKTTKGYKRLNSLLNKDYNSQSDKKNNQHNDKHTISFADAKRIDFDIRHMNQSPDNSEYAMIGGDMMKDWVHNSLGSLRSAVKKVQQVPEVPKLEKDDVKAPDVQKPIKVNGMEIKVESKLYDNDDFSKNIKKDYGKLD
jgi:hypothetical protein